MAIADNRNSKIPGNKLLLVVLISAVLVTCGSIGWIKFKQEQDKKLQQAQTLLNQACQTDISINTNVLGTFKQVDEATKLLRSVPNLPGLAYQNAQNELNNYSTCIKRVNANNNFFEAKELSKKALNIDTKTILTLQEWQLIGSDVSKAVDLLKTIPTDVDIYPQSQQELKQYQSTLQLINQKIQNEQLSSQAIASAEALNDEVDKLTRQFSNIESLFLAESKEKSAIQILKNLPNDTSLSETIKTNLSTYEINLRDIQYKIGAKKLQPLVKRFSDFAENLDASIGYDKYSKEINNLKAELNKITKESSAIKNHLGAKALENALNRYNDALIVWRYCHEGNCFNSLSAGILDPRPLEWLPNSFAIKGVALTTKYKVKLASNLFGQKYFQLNDALGNIWEQAGQDVTEAQSQI